MENGPRWCLFPNTGIPPDGGINVPRCYLLFLTGVPPIWEINIPRCCLLSNTGIPPFLGGLGGDDSKYALNIPIKINGRLFLLNLAKDWQKKPQT